MSAKSCFFLVAALLHFSTYASENPVEKTLRDALVCKGAPEKAVYDLVEKNNNFQAGYAASAFGEGTSYKAIVILNKPIVIASATTYAVISETDNSHFDFGAFTYSKFSGDYRKVLALLRLVPAKTPKTALGKYVSNQSACPNSILLTPLANGEFLLGCGWHNGC